MSKSLLYSEKLIIAGPCSAESEEQVLNTAKQLKAEGKTHVFRAGIWKPRTNPGGYEGAGIKGLAWLSKAKYETGFPIATEVATSKHVEDTLHYDVDILWIGARTTVNPFSVQNIADALKGTNTIVLIKNPINPDLKLWIGAIERLQKSGIEKIGLIHRGFSSFGEKEYRNSPLWQIPIEMKRLFPEIPMICDPSHIGGNTESLYDISQKSLNLDYQGLMIETHENPSQAWTDKQQQITPIHLSNLLERLVWKKTSTSVSDYLSQLENLREQINMYDDQLLQLIGSRMEIASEIGKLKASNNVTVLQSARWNDILNRLISKGEKYNLSQDFVHDLLDVIHVESIRIQNTIQDGKAIVKN